MRQARVIRDVGQLREDEQQKSVVLCLPGEPVTHHDECAVNNDEGRVRHPREGRPPGRAGRPPDPLPPSPPIGENRAVTVIVVADAYLRCAEWSFVTVLTCRLPTRQSLWSTFTEGICVAAEASGSRQTVRLQEFRAHPRPVAGRIPARHQFPDRAEGRVSQLLLSADHSRRLLWGPAL